MAIWDEAVQDLTALGGAPVTMVSVLISLIFGWYDFAIMFVVGMVAAYLVILLVKSFYVRDRPIKRKSKTFIQKMDAGSFPSMHSMRATVLYGLWAFFVSDLYFTLMCFLAIGLVLWTRVRLKKHWWTDVLGGFVFGVIIVSVIIIVTGRISM